MRIGAVLVGVFSRIEHRELLLGTGRWDGRQKSQQGPRLGLPSNADYFKRLINSEKVRLASALNPGC